MATNSLQNLSVRECDPCFVVGGSLACTLSPLLVEFTLGSLGYDSKNAVPYLYNWNAKTGATALDAMTSMVSIGGQKGFSKDSVVMPTQS
jgi:hypothetical protein